MRYETFGSKLRRMRAARGLTTKRLAELAGVTPSYLTQIQKGNREPPDDLVARLARVLALESQEASELRRVLKKERILRAINKSGAETAAATLAAEILETDDGVCAEAGYEALRVICSSYLAWNRSRAGRRSQSLAISDDRRAVM